MNIKLWKTIEVGRNGGESLYFYDIDCDGEKELLYRQSAGLLAQEEYRISDDLDDENFNLLCYTCFKQDGKVIWQVGNPWKQKKPYKNHGEINLTVIADINNDGKTELLYKYHDKLYLRDIRDGELIKEYKLPNDDGWKVVLQRIGENQYNIIVLGAHQMRAYTSDFEPLWEKFGDEEFSAFSFADVDDDGKEELFVADSMYDHDGTLIWKWDHIRHVDFVKVFDINEDGIYEAIFCVCHGDFVIFNINGKELFRDKSFVHPQGFNIGRFMTEIPGYQIFVTNKASLGGSVMLDYNGNKLWEYPCNGYCMTIPNKDKPDMILHKPSPGRMSAELQKEYLEKAKILGYVDLPIEYGKPSSPILLSGNGGILYRFPKLDDQPNDESIETFSGDQSLAYSSMIDDVDNDGQIEWIVYKRHKVWIFKSEIC